jgi:hypothetical protein
VEDQVFIKTLLKVIFNCLFIQLFNSNLWVETNTSDLHQLVIAWLLEKLNYWLEATLLFLNLYRSPKCLKKEVILVQVSTKLALLSRQYLKTLKSNSLVQVLLGLMVTPLLELKVVLNRKMLVLAVTPSLKKLN